METYHALTQVARPDPPTDDRAKQHAIAPIESKASEPEPTEAAEQPAAIVNQTLEELAREGARRMLERALAVEVDEFARARRGSGRLNPAP